MNCTITLGVSNKTNVKNSNYLKKISDLIILDPLNFDKMNDQYLLSLTLVTLLGLFIWGKIRYDALAVGALFVLVVLEIIPANDAFAGFAHPAVVTVALVLIISQGLKNSGLTGLNGKLMGTRTFTKTQFLISLLLIAAVLSSFINNIGALAILLPITLNICQKMDWHPSKFLMPLAFACILGGMNTAIGTPQT